MLVLSSLKNVFFVACSDLLRLRKKNITYLNKNKLKRKSVEILHSFIII